MLGFFWFSMERGDLIALFSKYSQPHNLLEAAQGFSHSVDHAFGRCHLALSSHMFATLDIQAYLMIAIGANSKSLGRVIVVSR